MKFKIFAFVMAFAALSAMADEGNFLHIRTSNGWSVVDIDKVGKIKFTGDQMVVGDKNDAPMASYPRTALEEMVVTETAGVHAVEVDAPETMVFNVENGAVKVLVDCDFEVYDTTGKRLVLIPGVVKGQTITLPALAGNVVILKAGNQSIKAVIK